MEYRPLGRTGIRVSALCLGGMTFGEADAQSFMHKVGASEKEAFAMLDAAVEAGVNFVDVADVYGQDGLAERVLGKWLAARGGRDELVIATKGRFRMRPGPNGTGASRLRIGRAIDESLKRLGLDHIDLYQIHMQDARTPEDELARALDDAVRAGKIVYVGASNYAAYRLMEALWVADKRGYTPFVSLQAQYHLACRDIEREHVPLCRMKGVSILPWAPLAGGLLTGKYRRDQPPPRGARYDRWQERYAEFDKKPKNWEIVEALAAVAAESGVPASQVALAWLLGRPGVTSVVFGARTVAQLADNLAALKVTLSDEARQKLDEVSSFELGYPYEFMQKVDGSW